MIYHEVITSTQVSTSAKSFIIGKIVCGKNRHKTEIKNIFTDDFTHMTYQYNFTKLPKSLHIYTYGNTHFHTMDK